MLYRLWSNLTMAILEKNMEKAQESKSIVEESQRELRRQREEKGEKHVPRFFEQDASGRWLPKIEYAQPLGKYTIHCI